MGRGLPGRRTEGAPREGYITTRISNWKRVTARSRVVRQIDAITCTAGAKLPVQTTNRALNYRAPSKTIGRTRLRVFQSNLPHIFGNDYFVGSRFKATCRTCATNAEDKLFRIGHTMLEYCARTVTARQLPSVKQIGIVQSRRDSRSA